jgi:dipeptidyl aminopeptidase/acylaminoacyl peptidase
VLFGNPERTNVRLSPDGSQISYLAPKNGVLNVWVAPVGDLAQARPVTDDRDRGVRAYTWAYTSQHILYVQDKGGDENWRIYGVNLTSGATRDLTPMDEVHALIVEMSPHFPQEALIGLNQRNSQLHDIYRLDIETGEMALVEENPGFAGYVTDRDFNVRFAQRMTPDGGSEILRRDESGAWQTFLTVAMEDTLTTNHIDFDKSGRMAYMMDSRGRNTAALVTLDTETGETRLLAEDDRADMSDSMIHPTERTLQAVAFTYERKEWQVLDSGIQPDLDYLARVNDGEISVLSRTLADDAWIVAFGVDNGPVRYYFYDRTAQEARFLFTNQPALEAYPLAPMHSVVIPARDGLNLVSYYTLPPGSATADPTRPDQPLPMVLYVHGGPWARDGWGYNPMHQWLANRGYAVLSVNFRSSTGFGKEFLNAGNLAWGKQAHDDLLDAVAWAVDAGIAQADQVAIMGGSYGGYATLAGLTFTPEVFACGVDIVGPSNLLTLLESLPPYWQPMIELFAQRVGDHRTEAGRALLWERSPLSKVDAIRRPLLIGQGANDPRVKQAESDQIVAAMQERGIPVTYALYPDEGHGFARPENRLSFFALAEAFLAQTLEGRYEPMGQDMDGSSLEIVTR